MTDQIGWTSGVTRFEVIDDEGRRYVVTGARITLSFQDEGKTLKVFVRKRETVKARLLKPGEEG